MTGYLTGFLVYTLAMLGVIFVGFVVVKKSFNFNSGKQNHNYLKVESSLSLEPRKNLYVIKAGKERFLISTGIEGCQFMTKIEKDNIPLSTEILNEEVEKAETNNPISKMMIPKLEMPALSPDYIGLKEILRAERF
ncbi:MAG: flagellar biosynthetic protein FliO [bacterium]